MKNKKKKVRTKINEITERNKRKKEIKNKINNIREIKKEMK